MMRFGVNDIAQNDGIDREWLLTNGKGSYCSATITGANSRRYHGLMVASLKPPADRHLVLSRVDECIIADGHPYNLYSGWFQDGNHKGRQYLQEFVFDEFPEFTYYVSGIFVIKKISMLYGENALLIQYIIKNTGRAAEMKITPLINFRNYHHTIKREHMRFSVRCHERELFARPYDMNAEIRIVSDCGRFIRYDDCWYMGMHYPIEQQRGLDHTEDHYIPGTFSIMLEPWQQKTVNLYAVLENTVGKPYSTGFPVFPEKVFDENKRRLDLLVDKAVKANPGCFSQKTGLGEIMAKLALDLIKSADAFIVDRHSTSARTILAGYPWFTDWGRDTMIAFAGLTLCTARYDDARQILRTFAQYTRNGIVPNMFPDGENKPLYNTVDAALWMFEAVYKYLVYTKDKLFVKHEMLPVLTSICKNFIKGTLYNIKMDHDSLVSAGTSMHQLTWMDSMAGGEVVVKRHGKAVEINSLWYNAIMILNRLQEELGALDDIKAQETKEELTYSELADKVKASFEKLFWNEKGKCLYDVVNENGSDSAIRPNQLFAISLSFPVLSGEKAASVFDSVTKELYTQMGLRSLSPESPDYKPWYGGGVYERDSAYHQGTVWAWLIGAYITAFMRTRTSYEKRAEHAALLVIPFIRHLEDGCIGHVSEIFEGDFPHRPKGCFAQAWSTGELLRVIMEEVLPNLGE